MAIGCGVQSSHPPKDKPIGMVNDYLKPLLETFMFNESQLTCQVVYC